MKKLFIAVEGRDGIGKSEQVRLLMEALQKKDIDVIKYQDLYSDPYCNALSKVLLDKELGAASTLHIKAECLLVTAIRAQGVNAIVIPALAEDKWVVADRYVLSTLAHQGVGDPELTQELLWLHAEHVKVMPHLTIILTASDEIITERLRNTGKTFDRIESKSPEYHKAVGEAFTSERSLDAYQSVIGNAVVIIDASGDIQSTHLKIMSAIERITTGFTL